MINESKRKGIVLAGGTGTRLSPLTLSISKQLLPVFDKPMIYYPLTTLMMAGIRDILIITKPEEKILFEKLLGNGNHLGISIHFEVQPKPRGIAESFLIASDFIGKSNVALILGDNLFHGDKLIECLQIADAQEKGGTVFAYPVKNPESYGVVEFDEKGRAINIEEKPNSPRSTYAITGLYFYDNTIVKRAKHILPSDRGELEITSVNQSYLQEELLQVQIIGRGTAWLDTGTFESLHEAGSYIKTLENRQGLKVGCPEEVAWRNKWITSNDLVKLAQKFVKSGYGDYLKGLSKNFPI